MDVTHGRVLSVHRAYPLTFNQGVFFVRGTLEKFDQVM